MISGGIDGSVAGALLTGYFSKLTLVLIFVAVSVVTVIGIYLYKLSPSLSSRLKPNFRNITIGAFLLNLVTGMRGGHGGSLFPPFIKALGLDPVVIIYFSAEITVPSVN